MSISSFEFQKWLDQLLQPESFSDYCPNGLQVQGKKEITKAVFGVTANLALIEAAIAQNADALVVHHGIFWKGDDPCVRGQLHARLSKLLLAEINLFAYHLPLDAHRTYGNNAQWGQKLGLNIHGNFGQQDIGFWGKPTSTTLSVASLVKKLTLQLGRKPTFIDGRKSHQSIQKIAWCSGAAQSMIVQAHAIGADVYMSGEISEPTQHFAQEMGMVYLACGHHASERMGVQALSQLVAQQLPIVTQYIEIDNCA